MEQEFTGENQAELERMYKEYCELTSDINEHLPTLFYYYNKCEHVTEFGVRGCISLHAALVSLAKKVVAYDISPVEVPYSNKLIFICASTLDVEIEQTDMLFIDTLHTYGQLIQELRKHSGKVNKYIAMHDTCFFGEKGEDGGPGLLLAVEEFLAENDNWKECYHTDNNNGLTIIQRV